MRPVVQSLVLADRVYQDVGGKKIICGTFNTVLFGKGSALKQRELTDGTKQPFLVGPAHGGSPYAYISVTDILRACELDVQFVNLTKNAVLFRTKVAVNCADRLQTVEVVLPLPLLPIDGPGVYSLEVVCEGKILGSHRIVAKPMSPDASAAER